jgi:type IV secretory pathway VirB10-like protein
MVSIYFLALLFHGHKDTPQEVAQRQIDRQYAGQTAPTNLSAVGAFINQTTKDATAAATEKALKVAAAKLQGLDQSSGTNPMAVPGNPDNTDPAVYKAWADAEALQKALLYGAGAQPGNATQRGANNARGATGGSPADEARKKAKERTEKRMMASSMAVDFTQPSVVASPAKYDSPPTQNTEAGSPAPSGQSDKQTPDEKVEPIPVKMHTCIDLCEGDLLPGVLTNRINGAQAGFADVMITEPVFSHDWDPQGRRLLIPVGSRVLGNVTAIAGSQAERIFVAFHKVRRPDGSTFSLDNFTGLDMAGASGLRDLVNHHYFQIFGAAGAIAAIGAVAQTGNSTSGFGYDPSVSIRNGFTQELGQESMQVLNRFLSVAPTMVVREGKNLVRVYVTQDLQIDEYKSPQGLTKVPDEVKEARR